MGGWVEPGGRVDDVLAAAHRVMVRDGVRGLSLRAVATEAQMSASGLSAYFGGRERLDRVLGRWFGHRRVDDLDERGHALGLTGLLPADDEDCRDERLWLGWAEVARAVPSLAACLAGVEKRDREVTAAVAAARDEVDLDLVVAVLRGLRAGCCDPVEPLSVQRARQALERLDELRRVATRDCRLAS